MAKSAATITIAAGDSVSSAVDLGGNTLSTLLTPEEWTGPAGITFMLSPDGVTYSDLFDSNAAVKAAMLVVHLMRAATVQIRVGRWSPHQPLSVKTAYTSGSVGLGIHP